MRIRVDQEDGENVEAIYLDGKRLAMCIEADDEEGWAKVLLPPSKLHSEELDKVTIDSENPLIEMGDPIDPSEWIEKTLKGNVEIVMLTREGLEDDGLTE